jgi:hypothetical protein
MVPAVSDKRIALAAVAGAHGVKGEVRLKLFSGSVDSLSAHDQLYVGGVLRRLLFVRDGGPTWSGSPRSTATARRLARSRQLKISAPATCSRLRSRAESAR